MATMIPDLTERQLTDVQSAAEAKLYRAFRDQLSQDFIVFFQVAWIVRLEEEQARDGEVDFVVCHPFRGFLCVVVKGGGVGFDAASGEWYSVDRDRTKHTIKDPGRQALKAKYSILKKLSESSRWRDLRIRKVICGHSVFFPDLAAGRDLARPDLPNVLVGYAEDLLTPQRWVERAFDFWHNEDASQAPMGPKGLDVFTEVFGHSFEVRPLLADALRDEEAERVRLTQEQARILDMLRGRRRVAISGGAGTGKTLLAVEKARRLAGEGFRTLLTCYNRQLADHLSRVCAGVPNLEVMSFHQLCYRRVEEAGRASGRDLLMEAKKTYPGADLYNVQYPNALGYSLDVVNDRYEVHELLGTGANGSVYRVDDLFSGVFEQN